MVDVVTVGQNSRPQSDYNNELRQGTSDSRDIALTNYQFIKLECFQWRDLITDYKKQCLVLTTAGARSAKLISHLTQNYTYKEQATVTSRLNCTRLDAKVEYVLRIATSFKTSQSSQIINEIENAEQTYRETCDKDDGKFKLIRV